MLPGWTCHAWRIMPVSCIMSSPRPHLKGNPVLNLSQLIHLHQSEGKDNSYFMHQVRRKMRRAVRETGTTIFEGHVMPGCYFLAVGLLWSVKYPLKYFMQHEDKKLTSNKYYRYLELLEGIAKVIMAVVGFLVAQFIPGGPYLHLYREEDHSWVDLLAWTHGTMYLVYGLSGVVDVLASVSAGTPRGLDRFMLSQALFVQGFLFYAHNHNRSPLDHHLHSLMLLAILGGAACTLLEAVIRDHPILELLRTSMFLLQGSWFWKIGFVLDSPWGEPSWDQADHENIMFISLCFCWHYMGILFLVTFNYTIVYSCIKWKKCSAHREFGKLKFSRRFYIPLTATDHGER